MALNYTVTMQELDITAGAQVNLTYPTIVLTISPNTGYTVTAGDFSIGDPLPSEFTGAVFTQSGNDVLCTLTVSAAFLMPSNDLNLGVDIDGVANPIQYSVSGNYNLTTNDTNQTTGTYPYSASGDEGEVVQLFALTITANAGFRLTPDPTFEISILNGYPANYSVSRVDTTTTVGNEVYLTQVVYTVSYTFPAGNASGDVLNISALAEEYLDVIGNELYYSYDLRDFPTIDINGTTYLNYNAQQRLIAVYGDVGARITMDIQNMTTMDPPTNIITLEPITFTGGYKKVPVDFPAVVSDTTWNITFSGDQDPGFVQPDPLIVIQQAGISWTLDNNAEAGYTIVRSGDFTVSGPEGVVAPADRPETVFDVRFTITADDGSVIKLLRTPTWEDISNADGNLNGGTFILHRLSLDVIGDGTRTVVIQVTGTVVAFGNVSVTSYLSLANLFNANPVAVDDLATVNKGESILIDVLVNDTDGDGHTLRPVLKTQPIFGTAVVEGSQIRYTHDNSSNYSDNFVYAANDGYIDSNLATVNITVGVEPGESVFLSGTTGVYYIPVVVGDGAGTFTAHFDSGNTPDRIELIYENQVVADSLFIGDDLTDGNRAAAITSITGTSQLNSFDYVGQGGDGINYGATNAWNLNTLNTSVSYADPADIAPTGNTRTDPSSNFGNQVGVGNLVYTSPSDTIGTTGLDSADGNASIKYTKTSGGDTTIIMKVTGIDGTGWSIYQTEFS